MAERAAGAPAEGEAMRAEHIQRRHVGSYSAALPAWAAGKFTEGQAAVMRAVGIEMLNKRGGATPGCALRLEVIADVAGVSVGTARDALNIADTIGLVTTEHLRGFYDIRIRSPEWLPALREHIEWSEQGEIPHDKGTTAGRASGSIRH
jgi:Bacterial regulatory proteins, gntR family